MKASEKDVFFNMKYGKIDFEFIKSLKQCHFKALGITGIDNKVENFKVDTSVGH